MNRWVTGFSWLLPGDTMSYWSFSFEYIIAVILIVSTLGFLFFLFTEELKMCWDVIKGLVHDMYLDLGDAFMRCFSRLLYTKKRRKRKALRVSKKEFESNYAGAAQRFSSPVIAVISFDDTPFFQKVFDGFCDEMTERTNGKYPIIGYNARGSKESMVTIFREISTIKHGVIVPIGSVATLCLKEAQKHFRYKIPVVFVGVKNPVEMGIVDSLESSGNLFTGVTGVGRDYVQQMSKFTSVSKRIKKILIPFSVYAPWVQDDIKKVSKILTQFSTQIVAVPYKESVDFKKNVIEKLFQEKFDLVLTMRDILSNDDIDALVSACNRTSTPIYSSDTPSLERGVAMAFGGDERLYGTEAVSLVFMILEKGIHPSSIPITQLRLDDRFWINVEAAKKQGINNPSYIADLVRQGRVYKK